MITRFLIFGIASFSLPYTKAQEGYCIINDKDGYVNVRDKPSLTGKILRRISEDDIFYSVCNNDDWCSVYTVNDINEWSEGFIHKNRIALLSSLPKINTFIYGLKENQLKAKNDTLLFRIELAPFDSSKHRIQRGSGENGRMEKIDDAYPFGCFDRLPFLEIKFLQLIIHDEIIEFPKNQISDFYEVALERMSLYSDKKGRLFIFSSNSDGAGGYEAVWIIKNGKYLRRKIFRP